jgi:hypothetical protein
MSFEWILVPAIIGLSYLAGLWFKACPWIKDELIPALVGTVGAILGAVAYFMNVSWLGADDILMALFIGAGSGLASTGVNQIWKQAQKMIPQEGDEIHEGKSGDEC